MSGIYAISVGSGASLTSDRRGRFTGQASDLRESVRPVLESMAIIGLLPFLGGRHHKLLCYFETSVP